MQRMNIMAQQHMPISCWKAILSHLDTMSIYRLSEMETAWSACLRNLKFQGFLRQGPACISVYILENQKGSYWLLMFQRCGKLKSGNYFVKLAFNIPNFPFSSVLPLSSHCALIHILNTATVGSKTSTFQVGMPLRKICFNYWLNVRNNWINLNTVVTEDISLEA